MNLFISYKYRLETTSLRGCLFPVSIVCECRYKYFRNSDCEIIPERLVNEGYYYEINNLVKSSLSFHIAFLKYILFYFYVYG